MTVPYGIVRALTGAIGEADTEIGGLFMTRLTTPVDAPISLAATLVWNGTLTVTTTNTSELVSGGWVWLDADAQWFQVDVITTNVSFTILNPYSKVIPTGSGPSSKARQSFPVETTVDWLSAGRIGIDGIVYRYTSKTNTAFDGITYLRYGEIMPGALRLHRTESTVLDLNRVRNALDLVRRAMCVEYAEGEDLNAIGRNLGVNRLPFISSDDRFREIIKALAYNPKGTMLGLQLALDGLVGKGNYSIYENLKQYPCTVFVRLLGSAATNAQSQGKAYLSGAEEINCTNEAAIPLSQSIVNRGTVHSIYFKPEDKLTDCRTAYPSADQIEEYPGASLTPVWTLQGTGVEGTDITLYTFDPSGGTRFLLPTNEARYARGLRIAQKSIARVDLVGTFPGSTVEAQRSMAVTLSDGVRGISAVFHANNASSFDLGLVGALTGPFGAIAVPITQARAQYVTLTLEKYRDQEWRLYVNGRLRSTVAYGVGDVASPGSARAMFGISGNPAVVAGFVVKQASVWVQDDTDFASARGSAGIITAPDTLDLVSYSPQADDIGKTILLAGLTATNGSGGKNNGRWAITARSGTQVTLGPIAQTNATVPGGVAPTRISVPLTSRQFQFPDDLGRSITISGSTLGNNGTWVIQKLLDPDTLVDLSSWASHEPIKTNVCEVTGASFVPETGLAWQLSPDFVNETPVAWAIPESIDVTGGNSIALRQPLPTLEVGVLKVLAITYSDVLSAGILVDINAFNEIIQEVPELWWKYYPFYLSDPLGFVRTYLDEITAAGVIPDFQIV